MSDTTQKHWRAIGSIVTTLFLITIGVYLLPLTNKTNLVVSPKLLSQPMHSADSIALPPQQREFVASSGDYVFVVSNLDRWESPQTVGELFEIKSGQSSSLWKRNLPHEYGPRYVLVSSSGKIILFDEWINVKSQYALMLLNQNNGQIGQYSFAAIQEVLNLPIARIVEMANLGWWMVAPPKLMESGDRAMVEVGGKILEIDLENGEMTLKP